MAQAGMGGSISAERQSASINTRMKQALKGAWETLERFEGQLNYLEGITPQKPTTINKEAPKAESYKQTLLDNTASLESFLENFIEAVNRLEQF